MSAESTDPNTFPTPARPRLRGMTLPEMEALLASNGFAPYRARQLFHWIQRKGARSLDEMTNLPRDLRVWLAEHTELGGVAGVETVRTSADGSYKFLFRLDDDRKVESVLMPDARRGYWTQCLSSQVGCAVDCKFCVTGFNGFFRQMRADEITDQVLFARRHLLEERPGAVYRNLVYMGMGEPLLNTDNVLHSLRILTDHQGIDLSPRRITVSTSGITPGMIELADSGLNVKLALSLNATSQEQREAIMPITRKYPLQEVLDICRTRQFGRGRVTFEYVILAGFNDGEKHARQMAGLLRGIRCKINLIPFNPSPLLPFERPDNDTIDRFARILTEANYTVSVRWSKALDVDGACGQLAGQHRQRRARPIPAADAAGSESPTGDLDFFAPVASEEEEDD